MLISESTITPGQEFDGYKIIRVLGRGGFGEVWLCRSQTTGHYQALKFISGRDADLLEKEHHSLGLYRSAAARLRSPHLVSIEHIKLEAFYSRGKDDYVSSKDIEDIVAVIDGRVEILDEIQFCAHYVRGFISQSCRQLLGDKRFMDSLSQIVPDDQRETVVEKRLRQLSMA